MAKQSKTEAKNPAALAAKQITVANFTDIQLYLSRVYKKAKNDTPKYTVRKFANDVGFGMTTTMHQIIRGHRPVTNKTAEKIATGLSLDKFSKQYFIKLAEFCMAATIGEREAAIVDLLAIKEKMLPSYIDKSHLEYFSEWYHSVIRELVALESFQPDPKWIQRQLNPKISLEAIERSMFLLEHLGYIEFDREQDRYVQCAQQIATSNAVQGLGVIRAHQKFIDLGRASLTKLKGDERSINALTIRCAPGDFEKLKALIHNFQMSLAEQADQTTDVEQIFLLNMQLFPVTNKLSTGTDDD